MKTAYAIAKEVRDVSILITDDKVRNTMINMLRKHNLLKDLNIQYEQGKTLLHEAILKNDESMIKFLVDNDEFNHIIMIRDECDNSVFHYATWYATPEILRLLICKMNQKKLWELIVEEKNEAKETPYEIAVSLGKYDHAVLLSQVVDFTAFKLRLTGMVKNGQFDLFKAHMDSLDSIYHPHSDQVRGFYSNIFIMVDDIQPEFMKYILKNQDANEEYLRYPLFHRMIGNEATFDLMASLNKTPINMSLVDEKGLTFTDKNPEFVKRLKCF